MTEQHPIDALPPEIKKAIEEQITAYSNGPDQVALADANEKLRRLIAEEMLRRSLEAVVKTDETSEPEPQTPQTPIERYRAALEGYEVAAAQEGDPSVEAEARREKAYTEMLAASDAYYEAMRASSLPEDENH